MIATTKIAGVTFENRQELLKNLYNRTSIVRLVKTPFKNTKTNVTELAIQVIDDNTKNLLGYIPKQNIDKFTNISKMILNVSYYNNIYSGELREMIPPSKKQYAIIKKCIEKGKLKEMPIYDKNIFGMVIESLSK